MMHRRRRRGRRIPWPPPLRHRWRSSRSSRRRARRRHRRPAPTAKPATAATAAPSAGAKSASRVRVRVGSPAKSWTNLNEAEDEARRLWRLAFDAEQNQDFVEAVNLYEQIKKLPPSVHPAGLEVRLSLAKKLMK
jgi:hypothetical protein